MMIGRAAKGSLTNARPDDLCAFAVRSALEKVPQLDRERNLPHPRLCLRRTILARGQPVHAIHAPISAPAAATRPAAKLSWTYNTQPNQRGNAQRQAAGPPASASANIR